MLLFLLNLRLLLPDYPFKVLEAHLAHFSSCGLRL